MPCNAIATASATLADLTADQFAELCQALGYKVYYKDDRYGVGACTSIPDALDAIDISWYDGNLSCSTTSRAVSASQVNAVKDKLVTAANQKRALLVLMALNQIGRVTQSQRTPNAWVLNVEV